MGAEVHIELPRRERGVVGGSCVAVDYHRLVDEIEPFEGKVGHGESTSRMSHEVSFRDAKLRGEAAEVLKHSIVRVVRVS